MNEYNRTTQPDQDGLVTIEDDPAEDGDEEGAAGAVRRPKRVATPSNGEATNKRSKTNVTRLPPPKLNVGAPQVKGSSFSVAYLEGMKTKAECMCIYREVVEIGKRCIRVTNFINFFYL